MKPLSLLRLTCLKWFKHLSVLSLVALLSACAGVGVRADAAHNQARAHTELAARYYQVGQVAVAVHCLRLGRYPPVFYRLERRPVK